MPNKTNDKVRTVLRWGFTALAVVMVSLVQTRSVRGMEYGYIGIKPTNPDPEVDNSGSWFVYHLDPGAVIQDSVTVLNTADEENHVLIYAADSERSSGGGFALKQFLDPKTEVGTWVRLYPEDPPVFFKPTMQG